MLFVQVTNPVATAQWAGCTRLGSVVHFFNNFWVALADALWAMQRLGR